MPGQRKLVAETEVDVTDPEDIAYWADVLSCSKTALLQAIRDNGGDTNVIRAMVRIDSSRHSQRDTAGTHGVSHFGP